MKFRCVKESCTAKHFQCRKAAMNCTDLCGCSDTGEGCEAEYEYISDSDDDLDGEFN